MTAFVSPAEKLDHSSRMRVSIMGLALIGCSGDGLPVPEGEEGEERTQSPEETAGSETTVGEDAGNEGGAADPPTENPGHLATQRDAQASEPPCDNSGSCCPSGTTAYLGTAGADVLSGSVVNRCWVTLGGNDSVTDSSASGTHALLGGSGNDTLNGGFGPAIVAGGDGSDSVTTRASDDEIYGQGSDDTLNGGSGDDLIEGGAGVDILNGGDHDDILDGGAGNDDVNGDGGDDILVGGAGADDLDGGAGNDTVIVYDLCELTSGEKLAGGAGTDTLQIPVPLLQLPVGVTYKGFEHYVVRPGREPIAECVEAYADWDLIGRAVTITSTFDQLNGDPVPQPPMPSDQNPGPTTGGNHFVPMETGGIAVDMQSMLVYSVSMSLAQANAFALTVDPQTANGQTTTPLLDTATEGSGSCDRIALDIHPDWFPRSAIGKLETAWNVADPHCTGALVGPRHVLTNAHCIYRSDNVLAGGVPGYADSYLFTAGETVNGPVATPVLNLDWIWFPKAWGLGVDAWTNPDAWPRGSDIALLVYAIPVGATPPGIEVGGWFGWWWQSGLGYHDRHYFMRGYPSCDITFCNGTSGAGISCDWQTCIEDQLYGAAESCDCGTLDSFDNEADSLSPECGDTCWNSQIPDGCLGTPGMSGGPFYFYNTDLSPAVHVIAGVHWGAHVDVDTDTWYNSYNRRMTPMVSDGLIWFRETYP